MYRDLKRSKLYCLRSTAERSTEGHKRSRGRMQHTSTLISLGFLSSSLLYSGSCYSSDIGFNANILITSNSYLRLTSSFRVSCKPAVGKSTVRSTSFIVTFKLKVYPSGPISLYCRWRPGTGFLCPRIFSSATFIQIPVISATHS